MVECEAKGSKVQKGSLHRDRKTHEAGKLICKKQIYVKLSEYVEAVCPII